ncbi:transketolase family protein [Selenomonas sp. KH1T6]|uniref:transketolase family protein n=1 Tax=Selenomonas sp. KH1T6 TaxID=3158784 RepID=UPI0008A809D8|nr:transketolase subunit B [Selenomonas ruminantium]
MSADFSPKAMLQKNRFGMRKAFGLWMEEMAEEHDDLMVIAADVASSAGLQGFAQRFPEKFLNVGIAEQNMAGIAAGLAREGSNVFIVSFAPFVTMRAYEALRTLVGYMHLNVKAVSLASGFSLGVQGNTHYCLEDLSLVRTIPGMLLLSPADCMEEGKCLEYMLKYDGPAFLRLTGIDGSPAVYRKEFSLEIGRPYMLRDGEDILLLGTGAILSEGLRTARALKSDGLSCAVYDVATLKPLFLESLQDGFQSSKLVVTLEEHFRIGGLGDIVAAELAALPKHAPLLKIGIMDEFPKAGDYTYMLATCGMDASAIRGKILATLS